VWRRFGVGWMFAPWAYLLFLSTLIVLMGNHTRFLSHEVSDRLSETSGPIFMPRWINAMALAPQDVRSRLVAGDAPPGGLQLELCFDGLKRCLTPPVPAATRLWMLQTAYHPKDLIAARLGLAPNAGPPQSLYPNGPFTVALFQMPRSK
jgi:hypothetical protein